MRYRKQNLLLLSVLTASLATAFAQDDTALDSVVVTATRQPTRSNELMSDVSVITRDEIEESGATSIEQLLSQQPGIQYTSNGGPGTSSNIYIRGTNSNQSIVLIDGQRVSSATQGTTTFSRIPLSQIERIEILRGPASSLYGADAIGGVIQIFTRRGEGPMKFNASTGYGSYNTSDTSAGVSGETDITSYSLQAGYYETDGVSAISNPQNSYYNPDSDGYKSSSVSGNFAVRPAPGHEIGLQLYAVNGTSKYDSSPKAKDYANNQNTASYSLYSKNRFSPDWTSTLRVGTSVDDSTNTANGIRTSLFRTDQDQILWQNDIKLPVGTALLAFENLSQRVTSTVAYKVNERTIHSLLGGWTGSLGNHRFQVNLRSDDNSQYGVKTTGSGTYGYQLTPDWRAHVSYGTAFRAPTFNELYYPLATYSNPNLQPEEAKNGEVGATWENGAQRLAMVYYHNKINNLIAGSPLININHATLEGTTLSYTARFGDWSVGSSVDLLDAKNDETGKRVNYRAEKQMSSYVKRAYGAWNFGGEWQLVGDRFVDTANTTKIGGYGLVNLTADYRLEKNWTLFAKANNIFDKTYQTMLDYGTWGASVFVGIRYAQ